MSAQPGPTHPRHPSRRGQHGFALIEAFFFVSILGTALLWHAASSLSGHRLMRAEGSHGLALQTLRHFMERLRADEEWETLYARLAEQLEAGPPALGLPPSTYYEDFEPPPSLGAVGVLVEVPRAAAAGAEEEDPLVLREDIVPSASACPTT